MKPNAFALCGLLATFSIGCATLTDAGTLEDLQEAFKYCLAFRTIDHECVRESRKDNWTCADRPRLAAPIVRCVSWAPDAMNVCISKYAQGLYGYWLDTRYSSDAKLDVLPGETEMGLLRCTPSSLQPEPETVPELPREFSQAQRFELPKEKFPECIAVRIRTHECARETVDRPWSCSARPILLKPTAECLLGEHSAEKIEPGPAKNIDLAARLGVCRHMRDWGSSRFVTTNINPYSHDIEPILKCDETPSPRSKTFHTVPTSGIAHTLSNKWDCPFCSDK